MENQEKKKAQPDSSGHPKPSEDVQMNIETVTPETENDGLPNDQKHGHQEHPQSSNGANETDKEMDNNKEESEKSSEDPDNGE